MLAQTQPAPAGASEADRNREALILEHLPQVRLIARRIHARLPGHCNLDDLVSAGMVGLISAIDRFDHRQNVKLKTYAECKIRGAILDSLRKLDWVPREKRRKAKQIEAAARRAEQKCQHPPGEEEVAGEMGMDVEELRRLRGELSRLGLGAEPGAPAESGMEGAMGTVPDAGDTPSGIFERSELGRLIADALHRIPEKERKVLEMHYNSELTLREIAAAVQLSEGRVAQLKAQGILRVRMYVREVWPAGARGV